MIEIAELTESEFDRLVAEPGLPLLVDFYAPWCGPCKMVTPLLEQLAQHFAGRLRFCKVNVDELPELAGRLGITGVPTLLMIHEGAVCDGMVGFPSPRELAERLERLAGQAGGALVGVGRS